jgi:electron transport complex protein RnfG
MAGEIITPEGFSGDVTVMVGLNPDASIRKVIVTAQNETPGLGTAVTDRKRQKTLAGLLSGKKPPEGLPPNRYLDWYENKKAGAERWPIIKDGDSINAKTGATITSRAIDGAVFAIARTAADHLDELVK